MDISKAAIGGLAGVCLLAGAGGAYLATRAGTAPVQGHFEAAPGSDLALLPAVEHSEATVTGPEAAPASSPARAAAPVPAARPAPGLQAAATRNVSPPAPADRTAVREPGPAPLLSGEGRTALPPAIEPVRPIEPAFLPPPPTPLFEELVVAADSVIGLQLETSITSERARVEDRIVARVTRDVRVDDRVAIPSGARVDGEVVLVERGGRLREQARLGIRFTSIVLADGTYVPIETETIYREGAPPGGESAAKIGGGAVGGAIIGGILGGARGAAIGGSAGAGAGTAAVLAGGRNPAELHAGTPVTVRVTQPIAVLVED